MNYLCLDTATQTTTLALMNTAGEFSQQHIASNNRQSKELLPAIINFLKDNTLSFEDIDGIFVGIGPGSFTGTRVGVMTAKALSYPKKLPIVPFCSLKCFLPNSNGPFLIVTDAKNKQLYVLAGTKSAQKYTFSNQPELIKISDLQTSIPIYSPDRLPDSISYSQLDPNLECVAYECLQKMENKQFIYQENVKVLYMRECKDL